MQICEQQQLHVHPQRELGALVMGQLLQHLLNGLLWPRALLLWLMLVLLCILEQGKCTGEGKTAGPNITISYLGFLYSLHWLSKCLL